MPRHRSKPIWLLRLLACGASLVAACSSVENAAPEGAASATDPGAADASTEASMEVVEAGPSCSPVKTKSLCSRGGEAAIVRGIVHFDASRYGKTKGLAISLFLRHSFTYRSIESTIGGRVHGYARIALKDSDIARGSVPFEMDLCDFGVAMWSEENGDFNLVAILDADGSHDMSTAKEEYGFQTPRPGESVKMVRGIRVSCHGSSPCVELTLDCTEGTPCTTFTPETTIPCATPSCESDDAFCKGSHGH